MVSGAATASRYPQLGVENCGSWSGKPRPRWGRMASSSSRGDRWGAATGGLLYAASLGMNSRPGSHSVGSAGSLGSTRTASRRYTRMLPARALVAGALVTVFLVPGDRRGRPGVVDHHSSSTTGLRRTGPATATPRRRDSTDPEADRAYLRRLAIQVIQNQRCSPSSTRRSTQATSGSSGSRRRSRHPAEARRTRAEWPRLQRSYTSAPVHLPERQQASGRRRRHRAPRGRQRARSTRRPPPDRHPAVGDLSRGRRQLDAAQGARRRAAMHSRPSRIGSRTRGRARPARPRSQQKLLDQAGAIPVMGDAELTPADVTAGSSRRGVKYRLSGGISIDDLVADVLRGRRGRARAARARVRAVDHRDRSFGNALDNNYAGIGACDSCQGEPAFPTPRDGVRGQIQLLQELRGPRLACGRPREPAVAARSTATTRWRRRVRTTRSSPRAALPPGT